MVTAFAIFVMLAILSVLIIVHECGHFLVARYFGFQTPVFGFGLPFGPHWVVGKRWGTEFRIHACLLGGYVAIPELGDESNQEAFGLPLKPFRKFPIWQRALVAFAGVGFNILFAYLVMLVMFFSLGQPSQPVVVAQLIKENPIAMNAGIKEGDELVSIDDLKVTSPEDAVRYLTSHKSTQVEVHLLRKSQEEKKTAEKTAEPVSIKVTTNADGKVGMALIPKGAVTYKPVQGNFVEVAGLAAVRLWNLTYSMIDALGQMLQNVFQGMMSGGKAQGGKPAVGLGDLHGVLAVVKIGADIAQQDWTQLFLFTIMISMDLAIINLLPWPALDGGHLAFMAYEAVRGKPMHERAQGEIVKWGFISLILLMVVIMVNDVSALVQGKLDFKPKDKAREESTIKDPAKPESTATPGTTESSSTDQTKVVSPEKELTEGEAKEGTKEALPSTP